MKDNRIYLGCSFACSDAVIKQQRMKDMTTAGYLLEDRGFSVYNPSRMMIPNAWDYSEAEWGKMVFANDLQALEQSSIMVFLSYGKANSDGSVWECGYAFGRGKKVIVVHMDPESNESLMVMNGSYAQVSGLAGLRDYDFEKMPKTRIVAHAN